MAMPFFEFFKNAMEDKAQKRQHRYHKANAEEYNKERLRNHADRVLFRKELAWYAAGRPTTGRISAEYEAAQANKIKADYEYKKAQKEKKQAENDYNRGKGFSGKARDIYNTAGETFNNVGNWFNNRGSPSGGGGGGSPGGGSGGGSSGGGSNPFTGGGTGGWGTGSGGYSSQNQPFGGPSGSGSPAGQPGGHSPIPNMVSMGFQALHTAVDSPVTGVMLNLWLATTAAITGIRLFTTSLQNSNFEFAKFSTAMGNVAGQQMQRDYELARDRGDRRASSAEYLSENRHKLEETMSQYTDLGMITLNYVGGWLANKANWVVELPSDFMDLFLGKDSIKRALEEAGETGNPDADTMIGSWGRHGEWWTNETWDQLYGRPNRFDVK